MHASFNSSYAGIGVGDTLQILTALPELIRERLLLFGSAEPFWDLLLVGAPSRGVLVASSKASILLYTRKRPRLSLLRVPSTQLYVKRLSQTPIKHAFNI